MPQYYKWNLRFAVNLLSMFTPLSKVRHKGTKLPKGTQLLNGGRYITPWPSLHLLLKKQTLLPLLGGLPLLEQIPRPSVRQVVLLTRQHRCGKAAGCWQPAWASSKGHKVLPYTQLHVPENISATSVWPGEKQGVQSAKGRTGPFPKGKRVTEKIFMELDLLN